MKKIVVINASANIESSFSRRLSTAFIEKIKDAGYRYQVCYRDLAETPIPQLTQEWLHADSKSPSGRSDEDLEVLKISNNLIAELHRADLILLATPMYNWSVPGSLKAYLDQVLRFNETFTTNPLADGKPYLGLLKNKTLILFLSRGSRGYAPGERNEQIDFQSGYLKMVFGIMGVEHIHELTINGTNRNDLQLQQELTALEQKLTQLLHAEFKV